jgi:hypothetical protein
MERLSGGAQNEAGNQPQFCTPKRGFVQGKVGTIKVLLNRRFSRFRRSIFRDRIEALFESILEAAEGGDLAPPFVGAAYRRRTKSDAPLEQKPERRHRTRGDQTRARGRSLSDLTDNKYRLFGSYAGTGF